MEIYLKDEIIANKVSEIIKKEVIKNIIESSSNKIYKSMQETISRENQKYKSLLQNIYDTNNFRNNIFFIVKDINVNYKIDAEKYVLNYLKDTHYQTEWDIMKTNLTNTLPYHEIKKDIKGMPDLIVKNKQNNNLTYFVEVKTNGDGIKKDQILWCSRHPAHKIIFFFLQQNITKTGVKNDN